MKIVADQDIFAVEQIFRPLGELVLLPGRQISRHDLVDADALLVRSILPVDRSLLDGSAVKFVGTATSGIDHIDAHWLDKAGIALAHTRGANANAVVEYCLGALARLILAGRADYAAGSIGIIGAGAIGGRLARKMQAFGFEVVICDPPLAEKSGMNAEFNYQPIEAALDCDIVSLHVPLTFAGRHATVALLDADALSRLRAGTVLLQTSRGGVVDERALLQRLGAGAELHCAIDVWENEPRIDAALAGKSSLATPHIAGYSEQAKWTATLMLARQMAERFGLPASIAAQSACSRAGLAIAPGWARSSLGVWRIIDHCLALGELSSRCKSWAKGIGPASDASQLAAEFDVMRKPVLRRQEFSALDLTGLELLSARQRRWLQLAGFRIQPAR